MNVMTPSGARQQRASANNPSKFVLCGKKRKAVATRKGLIVSAEISGIEVFKKSFAAEFLAKNCYENLVQVPLPEGWTEDDQPLEAVVG